MNRKVVIFQELLTNHPGLNQGISQIGLTIVPVEGGREAVELLRTSGAGAAVLDVAMPQFSGIECCRQLKEERGSRSPRFVLVSGVASTSIEQRATDAGCDVYLPVAGAEEKIIAFLSLLAPNLTAVEGAASSASGQTGASPGADSPPLLPRAPRLNMPGAVKVVLGEKVDDGESVNASQSGILVAHEGDVPVGTPIQIRFTTLANDEFDLAGSVVRSVALKVPKGNLNFAIGIKFGPLIDSEKEKLEWVLLGFAASKVPKLPASMVDKILRSAPDFVQPIVLGQPEAIELVGLVGQVSDFEIRAFGAAGPVEECVRRVILLRAKCNAMRGFIPEIAENPGTLAPTFLPSLSILLQTVEGIGEEVDGFVRQAVEGGVEELRQNLNASSNHLYQAKVKLLYAVAEQIDPAGLGSVGEVVRTVQARVEQLRALHGAAQESVKYDRRKPLEPEKKEEKKKKGGGVKKYQVITAIVAILIVGIWSLISKLSERLSPEALKLPMVVERIVVPESGMEIYASRSAWKSMKEEEVEQTFQKIEEYLAKNNVPQAKVFDESTKLLGAVMSGKSGRKTFYTRRRYQ